MSVLFSLRILMNQYIYLFSCFDFFLLFALRICMTYTQILKFPRQPLFQNWSRRSRRFSVTCHGRDLERYHGMFTSLFVYFAVIEKIYITTELCLALRSQKWSSGYLFYEMYLKWFIYHEKLYWFVPLHRQTLSMHFLTLDYFSCLNMVHGGHTFGDISAWAMLVRSYSLKPTISETMGSKMAIRFMAGPLRLLKLSIMQVCHSYADMVYLKLMTGTLGHPRGHDACL